MKLEENKLKEQKFYKMNFLLKKYWHGDIPKWLSQVMSTCYTRDPDHETMTIM